MLRDDLQALGFAVEADKSSAGKVKRPIFFGEDGRPFWQYEIDGLHSEWRCGIEIEAGRQCSLSRLVDLDHLILAALLGDR